MSKPTISSKNTKLLPLTRQKVKNLCKTIKEKLTPWRSFKFYSVNITDFYGETYPIGGGYTAYEGTVVLSFFNFIVPFLEDAIVNTLDETCEICRLRGLKPEEPYIRETAMILEGYLIGPIYHEMADIDRHLRSRDGNLKSIKRRDVTDEIDKMVKFLDKSKDELIQGIKEQNGIRIKPQEKGGQGKKKRGRSKEHSEDKLKAAETLFNELQGNGKSVSESWFEVHEKLGFVSPEAAKQAVYRFKQQNKKQK